jgi:hypothetical protein
VEAELTAHFEDALRGCATDEEKDRKAHELVEEFGDAKLLAVLCRRAKKRCRPLWVRAFARILQAMGLFLLLLTPYTIWFVRGKPNPTIDYLPQLNALRPAENRREDNAWPYYERAMRLVVEPNESARQAPWFRSLRSSEKPVTPNEQRVMADWIEANSLAWLQLEFAAARQCCHRVYRRVPGTSLLWYSADDPPLAKLRRLAQLGLWRSRLALERGQVDEALHCCETLLRVGSHWETNALLLDQLMGQALTEEACAEILRIGAMTHLSSSELSDLQIRLARVYQGGYPLTSFAGERLVVLDMIQHAFTDRGFGGGHRVVASYTADLQAALPGQMSKTILTPMGMLLSMIHASRSKTVARANRLYDRMEETAKLSPYERRIGRSEDLGGTVGAIESWRYALVYALLPAERRASEIRYQVKADYDALLTVLAIKRYCLETGNCPPDLGALVKAGYLKELPMDPFSDQPLVYRLTEEDFLFYSVGRDFHDDSGASGLDQEGGPRLWPDKGDTVFWPLP